ncbi:HNH endonuclease [Phenylobacterium sp.]|uniref:HNH endonuclease n=1 Tax=Phenylobacterium sp. TaxID=1871053 RepID=UPI00286E04B1|nr:HNH endonuclease [Phenylobacterium sp.]
MKAVFDTKPNSRYDDEIDRRYHFPTQSNYLAAARAAVGDWIVYRETQRNGGRRAYIAVARVRGIELDPDLAGHAYAYVDQYLPFDPIVPFGGGGTYWEAGPRAVGDPRRVGATLQNKSMRALSDEDFAAIVQAGLSQTLAPENAIRLNLGVQDVDQETFETLHEPPFEQARRIEQVLLNRKIRDANFRRQVCEAYEDRCAVTGLRMINGGGKSEVQAAHIWGVGEGGPDVVQNGLALSGTVHWLFDRHLISLTDDYQLLVSHNKVPSELRVLFEKQMERIHLPKDRKLWPHPRYLARHREAFSAW